MNNFIFNTPTKVYFGKDSEKNLGKLIKEYGFKKVLFHYGKNSIKKIGLYDFVIKELNDNEIDFIELGGVEANPKLSLVEQGVALAKKEQIDFILAVGGGSVIDSAKSIAKGYYTDESPWLFNTGERKAEKSLPVGVILTIAAAGSEMSNSCVITNDYLNDKRGFGSELNRPLFAICNPGFTYSVSKYQTACGIVDIMMHTLERVLSYDNGYNPLTDNLAFGLIKAVLETGKTAYMNPTDYDARATLMWASSLSHNGLTACGRDYIMPVHQMEHALSGIYDSISHGAGLAILWPSWAAKAASINPLPFAKLGYYSFGISKNMSIEDASKTAIQMMKNYFKEIGMPTTLTEVNVTKESLEEIANLYTFNRTRTIDDIFLLDYNSCLEILNDCYE